MSSGIRARVKCSTVRRTQYTESVVLNAVYSPKPTDPNYSFSEATPVAKFEMTITNQDAWGFYQPGKTYDVLFTPVGSND